MQLLLNLKETCDYLSMSQSKIQRLVADQQMPAPIRVGGSVRWRVKDLNKWVDSLGEDQTITPKKKLGRKRLAT